MCCCNDANLILRCLFFTLFETKIREAKHDQSLLATKVLIAQASTEDRNKKGNKWTGCATWYACLFLFTLEPIVTNVSDAASHFVINNFWHSGLFYVSDESVQAGDFYFSSFFLFPLSCTSVVQEVAFFFLFLGSSHAECGDDDPVSLPFV